MPNITLPTDIVSNPESLLRTIGEAAQYASVHLRMPVQENDIENLLKLNVLANLSDPDGDTNLLAEEIRTYGSLVRVTTANPALKTLELEPSSGSSHRLPSKLPSNSWLVFQISPALSITIPAANFRSYEYQLFMRELHRSAETLLMQDKSQEDSGHVNVNDVSFVASSPELAELAASIWERISCVSDEATESERRVTPSIYGVKTRLLPFVAAVIRRLAPQNALVCDLMSGSGIVTRRLSNNHSVFSNDANSYGRILATALTSELPRDAIDSLIARLKTRMGENAQCLERMFAPYLVEENELLHSARTPAAIDRYREFCKKVPFFFSDHIFSKGLTPETARLMEMVKVRREQPKTFPFILATAYWANVHFGLRQAILIDSIRYAIEGEEESSARNILLAALIQASLLCSSGPHFAQPFKPRGPEQFKKLIDKRSKRLDAEFFAILSRRAFIPTPPYPSAGATKLNWREAIDVFTSVLNNQNGIVYADPPYTSVQYSRYYHVLNVIADYDYPVCSGPGICPVREYRFSSRFEFKAGPAKKELYDLIRRSAESDLDLAISYSKSGAVTVRDILIEMKAHYKTVEIFQTGIRHHAQGKAPPPGRLTTVEFILTGRSPFRPEVAKTSPNT